MQPLALLASSFLVATALVSSQAAFAEEPPTSLARSSSSTTTKIHLSGHFGGFGSAGAGGVLTGATVLLQSGLFEVGAQGQAGGGLSSYSFYSGSALAGVALMPTELVRVDLLAQVGVNSYENFGMNGPLLETDPGASATLPFTGLRAVVTHRYHSFEIGIGADYTIDLGRTDVQYSYDTGSFLGGPGPKAHSSKRVGTDRLAVLVSLGAVFDL